MNCIPRKHWLHPIPLLLITVILPYVSYISINSINFTVCIVYFSFIAAFAVPFYLIPYKGIQFDKGTKCKDGIIEWVILMGFIVLIIAIRLLNYTRITYAELASATPSWLFWSSILSWLACYRLLAIESFKKRIWLLICLILSEVGLLVVMGQRLWMVMFVMGLVVAFHVYIKRINYIWIIAGIAGFILIAGPLMVISRYSIQDERPFMEVFIKELPKYPAKIGDTLDRIGAKGVVLADLSRSLSEGDFQAKKREPRRLLKDVKKAAIPNIIKNEKHNLRPGTEVYTTFINKNNPTNSTYPSGIIGDTVWHFGWWAYVVLPAISLFLILLWNNVLAKLCTWFDITAIHFSYFFVLYDTHLVFFFTSWTRALVVYGMFLLILNLLDKLDIFWVNQKI